MRAGRGKPPSLARLWLAVFIAFAAMLALAIYLHQPPT